METPNYVQMFAEAQQAGRQMARQHAVENALAKVNSDPRAAQDELMRAGAFQEAAQIGSLQQQRRSQQLREKVAPQIAKGDYTGAQQQAAAAGDFELAKTLNGMHDDQVKEADKRVSVLGGIAHYLSTIPDPAQRKALWEQTAPHLVQQGYMKPEEAGAVDLTDQGLKAYEAQALDTKTQIEMEFKRRAAEMEANKFGETKRHNQVDETIAKGHLGVAQGQLGVAQGNLAERRKENPANGAGSGKWEPF